MNSSPLHLERPSLRRFDSYRTMLGEMQALGETIWEGFLPQAGQSPNSFVSEALKGEKHPKPGLVCESIYWAVHDDEVVGRISFRHELNNDLRVYGGHIGYEVRPSTRRRGVAREMLRQILTLPKVKRCGRVLLTCAPDNVPSQKTIVSNGGVLAGSAFVERIQRQTQYYWIDLYY